MIRYLFFLLVLIVCASAQRYPPHCDPDSASFQERYAFPLSRITRDPENTFWIQNMTIMYVADAYDSTYVDYIKITYAQKNWYDAENCRNVYDQAWSFGDDFHRMSRVYGYNQSPGEIHGDGTDTDPYPEYLVQWSPTFMLYDHRAAAYLSYRSRDLTKNYQIGYLVVPGYEIGVHNEWIEVIRPHEHVYYSNNDAPASPTSLPNWTWFHSHADTDPNSEFNQKFKACFDGMNDGTLTRMNDPMADLEGAQWEISVCFTGALAGKRSSDFYPEPRREIRTENGKTVLYTDMTSMDYSPMGRLTRDHIDELSSM